MYSGPVNGDDASVVGTQIADWIEVNIDAVDEKCLKSAIQRSTAVSKKRTGQLGMPVPT
jgi:hypothetical protein